MKKMTASGNPRSLGARGKKRRLPKTGGLLLLCCLFFSAFSPALARISGVGPDWKKAEEDVRTHLINLINVNTALPEGNEAGAAKYAAKVLSAEGIDYEIFEPEKGRTSIAARLKGNGKGRPLLLVSHLDSVGAEREKWSTDPFSAVEKDGYIHGRGAADDKDLTAIELAVFVMLKREKARLDRDVIFLAVADEETGGYKGMRWLIENHWDKISAEYAVNEGGGTDLNAKGEVESVGVQASEKLYYDIKMTASGQAGHGSAPGSDSAIYVLSRAISKLQDYRPAPRLNPITRDFFSYIVKSHNDDSGGTIEMLLSPDRDKMRRAADSLSYDPFYRALLSDTVTPTIIKAGYAANVVPSEASAVLNCRLLPDSDPDVFLGGLKAAVNEPLVSFSDIQRPHSPFPPPMPMNDGLYAAIKAAASELSPGAAVAGVMSTGATDSEFLRRKGVIAYGLDVPLTEDDQTRIHGNDERVPIASLNWGIRMFYSIVRKLCSPAGEPAPLLSK